MSTQFITFFLVLGLVTLSRAQKVNFTDCGPGNVKELRITPCTSDPCIYNLGTTVTVEADFVATQDADSLVEVIKGIVRGKELPFPEKPKEPCNGHLTPGCPIKKGTAYQFKASFEVKPFYPAIPIQIKYMLTDKAGSPVACIMSAAKILDPTPKKGRRKNPKSAKMRKAPTTTAS